MTATVVPESLSPRPLIPQASIVIAVDTASVAAQAGSGPVTRGVFMMDNMVRNGSSGEGTLGLNTACDAGWLIGFRVVPVNAAGASGDRVAITAFVDLKGNVFTGAGHPCRQPPVGALPAGSYWIGQALRTGTAAYLVQIEVTVGRLQPVTCYAWWTATLTAT